MRYEYSIYIVAESAITLQYGEEISIERHRELLALQQLIRTDPLPGFTDVSVAYNSLSLFFDPVELAGAAGQLPLKAAGSWLADLAGKTGGIEIQNVSREMLVPVCYDPLYGPDLPLLAQEKGVDPADLIRLHTQQPFHVFMLGFSPGFPYLGILPEELRFPRKKTPAPKVVAGSVGIAAKQTGIYPFETPAGWHIIGRTPLKLFDENDPSLCLLKAGDSVRFSPIDAETFQYLNQYADS